MTKTEFMVLMRFPAEWDLLHMYPDDLFAIQRAGYEPGHEEGSEHDRNGAFHWWLRQGTTPAQLLNLYHLAALDPDKPLGADVVRHLDLAVALMNRADG